MNQHNTSDKAVFLSDVHLGGFDSARNRRLEQELIRLVDYCEEHRYKIYVLGDLFDYWMEYPDQVPDIAPELRERFQQYNRRFGPTLYITGNHDNWTRGYLASIGFDVEMDTRSRIFGGQKALMLHGDGLDNGGPKLSRPLLHRLLRNPAFIRIYQSVLPPASGLKAMKWFSRLSRRGTDHAREKEKLNKWARMKLKHPDIDVIICGHDHVPRIRKFDFGTYLNLGTFCEHRSLGLYNKNGFSLVSWSDKCRELKPYTGTTSSE